MSSAPSLSDEQIATLRSWAEEGDGLPEIQKKLRDEFELRFTYLETRFLLEDLKIELKSIPVPEPEAPAEQEDTPVEQEETAPEGGVRVTLDTVLRPGAIVSGKADFGAGHVASWWIDQLNRLGFDPSESDFQPSEEQMISFQQELRAALQKSGL